MGAAACSSDDSGSGSEGSGSEAGEGGEGGGGGEGQVVNLRNIQVSPELLQFNAAVAAGAQQPLPVTIVTTSQANLTVSSIELIYTPGASDAANPAFRLVEIRALKDGEVKRTIDAATEDLLSLDLVLGTVGSSAEFTSLEAEVLFTKPSSSDPVQGTLRIKSNADGDTQVDIPVTTTAGAPAMDVVPLIVEFDAVSQGESSTKPIGINNDGSAVLIVDRMEFQGSNFFKVKVGDTEYTPGSSIILNPPLEVQTSSGLQLDAIFTPESGEPTEARLTIFSNDPTEPENGVEVVLRGNQNGPCIALNPQSVLNFGPRFVGQVAELSVEVINCGNAPLEISGIAFAEPVNSDFSLDFTEIPGFIANEPPTADNPVTVAINSKVVLNVRYVPDQVSPVDENNDIIPDIGTIVFTNNTFEAEKQLEVRGVGLDSSCPLAIIEIEDGLEVIPQTNLQLDGSASNSPAGAIIEYNWSVEQPVGSASLFKPSDNVYNPTFEVNVAGSYTFQLTVRDENNVLSCVPAEAQVIVIPDEAIHVELLWVTPDDPDESDEGPETGSDLDLHFVHPFAGGLDLDGDGKEDGWFDSPFDCFWFNPSPQWASLDPGIEDDPGLDRDDTDGAGPENLNLNVPENGKTYRVGVHYWDDHNYGEAYATVRVYIYGSLVWSADDVRMQYLDMWEVCSITWKEQATQVIQATNPNGDYKITPNYQNPFFEN
jgi:hypothetical protein